jgi:hypothetical protein
VPRPENSASEGCARSRRAGRIAGDRAGLRRFEGRRWAAVGRNGGVVRSGEGFDDGESEADAVRWPVPLVPSRWMVRALVGAALLEQGGAPRALTAMVLVLPGTTTSAAGGFWAADGAYERFVPVLVMLLRTAVVSRFRSKRSTSPSASDRPAISAAKFEAEGGASTSRPNSFESRLEESAREFCVSPDVTRPSCPGRREHCGGRAGRARPRSPARRAAESAAPARR